MANTIELAKNYLDIIDEVYKSASVTADLTSDPSMMRAGANVSEILYPQIEVGGLGNYDRNSGYTSAAVSLQWATARFNYDRGAKLEVDTMDNQESMNLAFTRAGAELQRTRVAPEADAFTFATICGFDGITKKAENLADAEAFLKALIEAKNVMDEDEVPEEGRILYATPTLMNGVMALDTTKSREILNAFTSRRRCRSPDSIPQSICWTERARARKPAITQEARQLTKRRRILRWYPGRPTTHRAAAAMKQSKARQREAFPPTTKKFRKKARTSTS